MHIAVVGSGKVGSALTYTLAFEDYVDTLSIVDVVEDVAKMTAEDVLHGVSAHGRDVDVYAYGDPGLVEDADIIVVSAGFPRKPGMSRRDLAGENAKIMRSIGESMAEKNPDAYYFVITNPVDAMTTLLAKVVGDYHRVIGTGTNLETSRFRLALSRASGAPLSAVEGYVGGEHGEEAVALWSTVKINGYSMDQLDREEVVKYFKSISVEIIRATGGTRWGPAGSFIEVIRGLALNTGRLLAYSKPRLVDGIDEPVYVTVPARIGRSYRPDIWSSLNDDERVGIENACRAIYKTYLEALRSAELV